MKYSIEIVETTTYHYDVFPWNHEVINTESREGNESDLLKMRKDPKLFQLGKLPAMIFSPGQRREQNVPLTLKDGTLVSAKSVWTKRIKFIPNP
jgi:hypothetical protein